MHPTDAEFYLEHGIVINGERYRCEQVDLHVTIGVQIRAQRSTPTTFVDSATT